MIVNNPEVKRKEYIDAAFPNMAEEEEEEEEEDESAE